MLLISVHCILKLIYFSARGSNLQFCFFNLSWSGLIWCYKYAPPVKTNKPSIEGNSKSSAPLTPKKGVLKKKYRLATMDQLTLYLEWSPAIFLAYIFKKKIPDFVVFWGKFLVDFLSGKESCQYFFPFGVFYFYTGV